MNDVRPERKSISRHAEARPPRGIRAAVLLAVQTKGHLKVALKICSAGPKDRPLRCVATAGASILILSSGSILPSSAADPVGKLSLLKRNATMSAACSGVSVPGAVAGIVVCVFS